MKSREILAIIADIATILGVSIVGFIGNPLVSKLLGRNFGLFDFVNGVLFYFIEFSLVVLGSVALLKISRNLFKQRNYVRMTLYIILLIFFWLFLTGSFGPLKDRWANLFRNEYLFPAAPCDVIKSLDLRYDSNNAGIVGKVQWKQPDVIDVDNYRVAVYLKYSHSYFYEIHKFFVPDRGNSSETELTKISTDGSFLVPNVSTISSYQGNALQGFIVAVIARLDGDPIRRYPAAVAEKNATEFKSIGAFFETLEMHDPQP